MADLQRLTDGLRRRRLMAVAVLVASAIPMARAVGLVRSSTRLQYNDYWPMIDAMLTDQGGWSLRGIIEARNEHPIIVPKLLYIFNAELFGGSNRSLGMMVVCIVALQVCGVFWLALHTDRFGRWSVATLTLCASYLLFAPQGAWNFVKAMSGAAWLLANLLVLGALIAQQHRRRWLSPALALAATLSYGTGLAAWPALFVVVVLRDRRAALRQWPTFLAGAVAMASYLAWYSDRHARPVPPPSLVGRVENVLELIGSVVTQGSAASALGAVAVLGIVGCSAVLIARRSAIEWIGLAVYGVGSSVLVASARWGPLASFVESRYTSLSALTWLALVALVVAVLPQRWWVLLVPVPLLVAASIGGQGAVEQMDRTKVPQDLRALGLRAGLDIAPGGLTDATVPVGDRLERAGHYPFHASFAGDCGRLGQQVSAEAALPPGARGSVGAETVASAVPGARVFTGALAPGSLSVECVVVVDASGRVIGAGTVRDAAKKDALVFTAVAPPGEVSAVLVRLSTGGGFVRLDDPSQVLDG